MKLSKWEYLFVIQQNWGGCHGWEDVDCHTSYRDARASLKTYRENQPVPTRLIRRRELNLKFVTLKPQPISITRGF